MTRRVLGLALTLILVAAPASAQLATYDFNGTATTAIEADDTSWSKQNGRIDIDAEGDQGVWSNVANLTLYYWKEATTNFNDDQEASVVFHTMNGTAESLGIVLRAQGSYTGFTLDQYEVFCTTTTCTGRRRIDSTGAVTSLGCSGWTAPTAGDRVGLSVHGTDPVVLRYYKNGTQVGSDCSDSDATRIQTGGQPGLFWSSSAGNVTARMEDWEADNYTDPGGGAATPCTLMLLGVGSCD